MAPISVIDRPLASMPGERSLSNRTIYAKLAVRARVTRRGWDEYKVRGKQVVLKVNGKTFATGTLTKDLRLRFAAYGDLTDDASIECE